MHIEVSIEKAQAALKETEEWGLRPENKEMVARALLDARNSLLGLVLTGANSGLLPNEPETNEFLYGKFCIAFEMGYRARALQNTRR